MTAFTTRTAIGSDGMIHIAVPNAEPGTEWFVSLEPLRADSSATSGLSPVLASLFGSITDPAFKIYPFDIEKDIKPLDSLLGEQSRESK
jgi:hypothetical protein